MSSGSAQDVVVEHFLRDIERRGKRLHCAVIGQEGQNSHGDMNLLYRKSRLDWRHRDSEGNKKSSSIKESSATVGKVRDLASFRRHFRMGFMTMPASQDLSPRPCSSAMAPRSQSCHSVGASGNGDDGDSLENGDHSSPQPPSHSAGRPPPTKPKRHPSTRLSAGGDHRAPGLPPPEAPPPPPPTQLPVKHSEKRNVMKKSDSGDVSGRKVPPIKPKRSPNTQLSFEPLPPRVPPPSTPVPRPSQDSREDGGEDEEPVYIEMVGRAFSHRDGQSATPHPAAAADSDSDESEAIYEEMKYPLPEESEPRHRLPPKQDRPGASKPSKLAHSSSSHSSSSSLPHQASSSSSKPKAPVCASISSPLPSSSSSTPVPQSLGSGPQPQRAPTPYLLSGSKSQTDSTNKIPAPFPNLLQHRPPLLAFPHPAAASSGIGAQTKAAKVGSISTQPAPASSAASSSTASTSSSSSKLPILQLGGPKEASGAGGAQPEKQHSSEGKDPLYGPAPGLRARSHSTPLPPSSQSSHYGHYHHHHHHHHHHHPSHYHHYRRADKDLPTSHSMKLGPQTTAQTQTQSGGGGGGGGGKEKEGKSVGFHLKSEKRERDREREAGTHSTTPTQSTSTSTTSNTGTSQPSGSSMPSPAPSSQSHSSSQRPSSRPLLYRSHTPHFLSHGLPAYHPPPPDSPMLWTYPSAGLKRPPAYDSLRGGQLPSPQPHSSSKASSTSAPSQQGKAGSRSGQFDTSSLSRDGSGGGASADEGSYWPMHRKLSFSHSLRETEKEERDRAWNGSTDALSRLDKEEYGGLGEPSPGGGSGIPVRSGGGGGSGVGGFGEGTGGTPQSAGMRALGRSGLPLPCQTFPACHRNGELGRLSRSSSTSGVRQTSSNVQRQCSLPRDALSQSQTQSPDLRTPALSHQQQQLQLHQQHLHQQQLHQQLHLQLQYQHLTHLSQCQPPASGGAVTQSQRDGKLLEVIERKRCLCKEIKAHRRPERSLCKQDSMPILPSWRRTPEPRKTGTPPCQRQQAVVWDTAI